MSLLGGLLGGAGALNLVIYPMGLLMASMFQTSIWFSFLDSFVTDDGTPPDVPSTGEGA
jgi:hypothetical protein